MNAPSAAYCSTEAQKRGRFLPHSSRRYCRIGFCW